MVATPRQTYPKSHRLGGRLQFARVFEAKVRTTRGPLTVYAVPNDLPHARLGISISRRVGIATRRTRIKRLIREAYRLQRHALPTGFDWVVVVRPHEPADLETYSRALQSAVEKLAQEWSRRAQSGVDERHDADAAKQADGE